MIPLFPGNDTLRHRSDGHGWGGNHRWLLCLRMHAPQHLDFTHRAGDRNTAFAAEMQGVETQIDRTVAWT